MIRLDHRQDVAGFTLVELLVSIALGITILLATTRLFVDGRESFQYQQQWLELHERGRHAIQFLSAELRKTGYPATGFSGTPLSASNQSGENGSDSLTISYQGARDCAGSSASTIRYYMQEGTLRCDGNGGSSPTPQTLTSHIEGLQFRFGSDLDGDRSIDRYLTATTVSDWSAVHTIQVALLLRSQLPVRQESSSERYDLLGTIHGPYNDYYLRKIYRTTVQLRNQ